MYTQRFPKAEHLCLRNDIDSLFAAGAKAHTAFPLRIVYREVKHREGPQVKVLLSVPKRKLRHAVDRNRVKRQIREAYRKHKHGLVEQMASREQGLLVAFIYVSAQIESTAYIEKRVGRLLDKISEVL